MSDSTETTMAPALSIYADILRGATLDDNPFSHETDAARQALIPALVDFMHATADFLDAAHQADAVPEALGIGTGLIQTATAFGKVDAGLVQ